MYAKYAKVARLVEPRRRLCFNMLGRVFSCAGLPIASTLHDVEFALEEPKTSEFCDKSPSQDVIPNVAHFVYLLPTTKSDFEFQFGHFLSIYAVWHHWRPEAIYLHTNVGHDAEPIRRARQGHAGQWAQLIFAMFNIRINHVEPPQRTMSGVKIKKMEHKAAFVRVQAVHDFGGIYVGWDVHALRDVGVLRETGFQAIVGRQSGDDVGDSTFMSVKCGKFTSIWISGMHAAYKGRWPTMAHSLPTTIAERLVSGSREVLIMDGDAFSPLEETLEETKMLFEVHPKNKDDFHFRRGRALPPFKEGLYDRWKRPHDFPDWARDWSSTYFLHAPVPDLLRRALQGFDRVTPRYVLERRSNFARAVYPTAWEMYREGIIAREELYD